MTNILLFDDDSRDRFLPLAFTRPICEFRVGILTIREKWEIWLQGKASYITQEYLIERFPIHIEEENYIINSRVLPSASLCSVIRQMESQEALLWKDNLIAARLSRRQCERLMQDESMDSMQGFEIEGLEFRQLEQLTDIFTLNAAELALDFEILTTNRSSENITESNWVAGTHQIFVEAGAKIECSTLNATHGPIYIGRNAEIMEGSNIRGPFALGEESVVKMGSKIYGATTIGPRCNVAGEIKNSVLFGFSNKAHEGYLGDSVLGEWCNLGANTNTSNLKNTYSDVRQWDYQANDFVSTGQIKCGLVMGDFSRSGIHTLFNTGTVVGVSAHIFGGQLPPKFIPSFAWGEGGNFQTFELAKALEVAAHAMSSHAMEFTETDSSLLTRIFNDTAKYRIWEGI